MPGRWYNLLMEIIKAPVPRSYLIPFAEAMGGDMVKAVVDDDDGSVATEAPMHSDLEALLLEQGSDQTSLWGINLYPELPNEDWLEYDSMINLRPRHGNRSRGVDDPAIRDSIRTLVNALFMGL
jgi:hypothetical protein